MFENFTSLKNQFPSNFNWRLVHQLKPISEYLFVLFHFIYIKLYMSSLLVVNFIQFYKSDLTYLDLGKIVKTLIVIELVMYFLYL